MANGTLFGNAEQHSRKRRSSYIRRRRKFVMPQEAACVFLPSQIASKLIRNVISNTGRLKRRPNKQPLHCRNIQSVFARVKFDASASNFISLLSCFVIIIALLKLSFLSLSLSQISIVQFYCESPFPNDYSLGNDFLYETIAFHMI